MQLSWDLFNNPVTENNNLFLDLSARHGDLMSAANFSTLLDAGFGPAQISLDNPPRSLVLEAVNNWMTKRLLVTDGAGSKVYEGFVAEISGADGYHVYNPRLGGLVNRAYVVFRQVKNSGKGQKRVRATVNDTASQARYGIFSQRQIIEHHGVMGTGQANRWGQTFLKQHRLRKRPQRTTTSQRRLDLTLWGYKSSLSFQEMFLRVRKQKDLGWIATRILQGGACQYLNTTDTSRIATIGFTARYKTGGDWKTPGEMLDDIASYGDNNYNMIFAQVWEDRILTFAARPTTVGFIARSDDARVWDAGRALTMPWLVRAGEYMLAEDFPAPLEPVSDIDSDGRAVLIRETQYDDVSGEWSADPYDLEERDLAHLIGYLKRQRKKRKHPDD